MTSKRTFILLGILFLCAFCFGGGVFFGQYQLKTSGTAYLSNGVAVNINVADKDTMMQNAGIGPVTAERIIASREAEGNFETTYDLVTRKIIGEEKFREYSPFITVE